MLKTHENEEFLRSEFIKIAKEECDYKKIAYSEFLRNTTNSVTARGNALVAFLTKYPKTPIYFICSWTGREAQSIHAMLYSCGFKRNLR